MPIIENDPWREQYFERVRCPKGVVIPTDDGDAYDLFPQERWVYNKLLIAESQNLRCAPHGLVPPQFPVFSKPIYNMRGMGAGSCIIRSLEQWHIRAVDDRQTETAGRHRVGFERFVVPECDLDAGDLWIV